jgi:hypothetical protein
MRGRARCTGSSSSSSSGGGSSSGGRSGGSSSGGSRIAGDRGVCVDYFWTSRDVWGKGRARALLYDKDGDLVSVRVGALSVGKGWCTECR